MKLATPIVVFFAALAIQTGVAQESPSRDDMPPAPNGKKWKLVWHDEFDGTKLDTSRWEVVEGPRRDELWSSKTVSLDGKGHLVMSVLKEGNKFLSGGIRTKGKFEHAFGYYVARVQFQKQQGHWTAFWLFNDSAFKIGDEGRDGTEIDIMEKPWLDNRVTINLHWDGGGKEHKTAGTTVTSPSVMQGFHTFSLLWLPDEYVFYIDGREVWRTKAGGVCQVPLYIKLTDEIGPWAGDIKKITIPDTFLVDYVRVYD